MAIELPGAIARYFDADRTGDVAAVAACFTADGVVRDEGHAYIGRDAIRAWKTRSVETYRYTVEPVAIAGEGAHRVVTGHLAGDFPGSPVDLRYLFTCTDDAISALEIKP